MVYDDLEQNHHIQFSPEDRWPDDKNLKKAGDALKDSTLKLLRRGQHQVDLDGRPLHDALASFQVLDSDSDVPAEATCVLPALQPSCYDALYRTVTDSAYGWFAFTMLLKLSVNLIFLAGQFFPGQFEWGLWLQILLIFSALLSHRVEPYASQGDNFMEQVAFLLLACVLSIVNSAEQDDPPVIGAQCVEAADESVAEDYAACAAVTQLDDASVCESIVRLSSSGTENVWEEQEQACKYIAAGDAPIEIPFKDLSCVDVEHNICRWPLCLSHHCSDYLDRTLASCS